MSKPERTNVSLRPSELVIAAIHNLEERKGSTANNIVDFISKKYNLSTDKVKGHVEKALKRGVYFGVFSENAGHYQLLDKGNQKTVKAAPQKKKKVTIKVPPGKRRKGGKLKKKPNAGSSAQKKKAAKARTELSKKCCEMKLVKGRKQKITKAIQQRRAQQRRKKSKPRVT